MGSVNLDGEVHIKAGPVAFSIKTQPRKEVSGADVDARRDELLDQRRRIDEELKDLEG